MKKANQKRLLGDLAIEGGNFTTAYFKKSTIKDLFDNEKENDNEEINDADLEELNKKAKKAFEKAICQVEDKTDIEVSFFGISNRNLVFDNRIFFVFRL